MTLYGLLVLDRSDRQAARSVFAKAYEIDKYNKLAFAKLAELAPDQIGPAQYLEHLRLALQETPFDLEAATAFAQYAEQLELYDLAAGSYGYCAELFTGLHPNQGLPPDIYLPWAISLYSHGGPPEGDRRLPRTSARADGWTSSWRPWPARRQPRTGIRTWQVGFSRRSSSWPCRLVDQRSPGGTGASPVAPRQLAWFYCFAQPDKAKALDWANKAYAEEPNSMAVRGPVGLCPGHE